MIFKPEFRLAKRDAYCRSCDEIIPKGAEMISWYSHRNRGQHIHLCITCAAKIAALYRESYRKGVSNE